MFNHTAAGGLFLRASTRGLTGTPPVVNAAIAAAIAAAVTASGSAHVDARSGRVCSLCDGVVNADSPPVYFEAIAVFLGLARGEEERGRRKSRIRY